MYCINVKISPTRFKSSALVTSIKTHSIYLSQFLAPCTTEAFSKHKPRDGITFSIRSHRRRTPNLCAELRCQCTLCRSMWRHTTVSKQKTLGAQSECALYKYWILIEHPWTVLHFQFQFQWVNYGFLRHSGLFFSLYGLCMFFVHVCLEWAWFLIIKYLDTILKTSLSRSIYRGIACFLVRHLVSIPRNTTACTQQVSI